MELELEVLGSCSSLCVLVIGKLPEVSAPENGEMMCLLSS